MRSNALTVDEYIETLPDDRREALQTLRELVCAVTPDVYEGMQYGMAVFSPGHMAEAPIFALASQKHYMSLYLMDADIIQEYSDRLGTTDCGQSCIRFRRLSNLNLDIVETMLRLSVARRMTIPHGEVGPEAGWRAEAKGSARGPQRPRTPKSEF